MKLSTFTHAGRELCGVVTGSAVHPFPDGTTVRGLTELGLKETQRLGRRAVTEAPALPLDEVTLRPPLRPASVRDFVAFEEHVEGVRRSVDGAVGVPDAWYDAPTFYFTNPHAIVGTNEEVAFPAHSVARAVVLEVAARGGGPRGKNR
jgi:2-keto-4-pentenoate hydratase/2-oxohepta-3-ene-1,7-dioic acid hydratase in catechol pathway